MLSDIKSLEDINYRYPNILNIVKLWFEGYKGFGKMQFMGYLGKQQAIQMIENAHKGWLSE